MPKPRRKEGRSCTQQNRCVDVVLQRWRWTTNDVTCPRKYDYCMNDDSEHDDLREIARSLKDGDNLAGHILSGGLTNYSYKIYLKNRPSVCLFAKIGFSYALLDRGKDLGLDRLTTEFDMMKQFWKVIIGGKR